MEFSHCNLIPKCSSYSWTTSKCVCLIHITATNLSETHFIIIFHSVIHLMLRFCVFWVVTLVVGWGFAVFQRNVAPSSLSIARRKAAWLWRCRRYVPVKCWEPLTAQQNNVTSQKTQILSSIAVRTSNLESSDALKKKKLYILWTQPISNLLFIQIFTCMTPFLKPGSIILLHMVIYPVFKTSSVAIVYHHT